jgi:N-acetyl-alpha-D-glucosaminyl L-malate synthase BshA
MKIGITCYPTYGGSGVVATELGIELAARGHEVHFISYAMPIRLSSTHERIYFHEVEVTSYPLFDHPPYTLALATKMLEVAEQAQLDLLHVHYAIPHSVSALLARMMAMPKKLPFITTLHGTDITLVGSDRSYLPITRFSIEQSDGVTSISNYLRERTIREFEIKRPIEVIPNFVNCDQYMRCRDQSGREQWAKNNEPILMHLSNFRPVKRITDVVDIFALVREKIPAKLVMMGDGPDRGAAEYIVRRKELQKDVFFMGKQDNVQEKLGLADLFLLPSEEESFGLAALEAMACEVPVIATNVGGVPEVVTDGVDGYLIPPHDVETGAERALEILTRPDRGRSMGRKARVNARAKYCANDVIPMYEAYYRAVLQAAQPTSDIANAGAVNASTINATTINDR